MFSDPLPCLDLVGSKKIASNVDTEFHKSKFENVDDSKFGDLNPGIAGVE